MLVLEPDVARAAQLRRGLDLLAAHVVNRLVDKLYHVKLVERHLGPRQVLAQSGLIAGGKIDAGFGDVLGAAPVGLEVIGELLNHLPFAPFAGEQHPCVVQVVEQTDVVMPAPRRSRIQTDGADLREILLGTGLHDIIIEGSPQVPYC